MTPQMVIFLVLAAIAVAGAVNVILQREPIHSAISLIAVMISLAGLFLLLESEFIAAVQVIVYAGAIMVLFVFVIMLLNAGEEEHTGTSRVALFAGIPGLLTLAALVVYALLENEQQTGRTQIALGGTLGAVAPIAHLLFRDFLLPFEVTSVLILIAIMGAVVLARRGED